MAGHAQVIEGDVLHCRRKDRLEPAAFSANVSPTDACYYLLRHVGGPERKSGVGLPYPSLTHPLSHYYIVTRSFCVLMPEWLCRASARRPELGARRCRRVHPRGAPRLQRLPRQGCPPPSRSPPLSFSSS